MREPTKKMKEFAEAIAERLDIDIDTDYLTSKECADFIDEYKEKELICR